MSQHQSVLKSEAITALNIKPEGIYVDGTLGRAGHSLEIAKQLTTGHLYCFDKDQEALLESEKVLKNYLSKCTLIHSDFRSLKEKLSEYGVSEVDGILLDLGVSSPQFDVGERGFSYRYDAELDMRMNTEQAISAKTIVNEYEYSELVRIFLTYGEEPFAKNIARVIEKKRQVAPINTTFELVELIKEALPQKVLKKKGHPAKKTFQALRIAVNDELGALEEVLEVGIEMLKEDGRYVVITFHSLEDRITKQAFSRVSKREDIDKRIPLKEIELPEVDYELVNRKPISASQEELENNQRSHSAKLRILRRISHGEKSSS